MLQLALQLLLGLVIFIGKPFDWLLSGKVAVVFVVVVVVVVSALTNFWVKPGLELLLLYSCSCL